VVQDGLHGRFELALSGSTLASPFNCSPRGITNQARRITTSPQPFDPAALAAICAADIPEHLPFPDPSARDQHL
jgi:hypothetical protein